MNYEEAKQKVEDIKKKLNRLKSWEIEFIEDFEINTNNKEVLNYWLQIQNKVSEFIDNLCYEIKREAKQLKAEIEKEFWNAQQYADMDEPDFWKSSTINQKEAQEIADNWSNLIKRLDEILK